MCPWWEYCSLNYSFLYGYTFCLSAATREVSARNLHGEPWVRNQPSVNQEGCKCPTEGGPCDSCCAVPSWYGGDRAVRRGLLADILTLMSSYSWLINSWFFPPLSQPPELGTAWAVFVFIAINCWYTQKGFQWNSCLQVPDLAPTNSLYCRRRWLTVTILEAFLKQLGIVLVRSCFKKKKRKKKKGKKSYCNIFFSSALLLSACLKWTHLLYQK